MKQLIKNFLKDKIDPSWQNILLNAMLQLDKSYIKFILTQNYLPSNGRIFNAFKTMPKDKVKYILFGQDPYPREQSAIGYAFIDGAVKNVFSSRGLSKEVNKATSLRNFIKMALVAANLLDSKHTSQDDIAKLDKKYLINSIYELKDNFEKNGVLLLNSALVFEDKSKSNYHIKMWRPFIKYLLYNLSSDITLILFGNGAKSIKKYFNPKQNAIEIEHPYNHSFIESKKAIETFKGMNLLYKNL